MFDSLEYCQLMINDSLQPIIDVYGKCIFVVVAVTYIYIYANATRSMSNTFKCILHCNMLMSGRVDCVCVCDVCVGEGDNDKVVWACVVYV